MKIFDCFMFFNELELLDLRLRTLYSSVDYFVLAEINITHSGILKEYYFDSYKFLFSQYNDKIIHIKEILAPNQNAWVIENAHRNLVERGIKIASPDDYIMISDADEIPNPEVVKEGISRGYESFGLLQELFCFYVNCKTSIKWNGTVVSRRRSLNSPQDARNKRTLQQYNFENGGWHYTSMGGKERIRTKFNSFAETAFNRPEYMSDMNLDECLSTGKDLAGRTEAQYQKKFISDSEITHREVIEWSKRFPNFKK